MTTETAQPLGLIDVVSIEQHARAMRAVAMREIFASLSAQFAKFAAAARPARNGKPANGAFA
jgi:hypothetical protein